jgi:hypothetical protein
VRLDKSELADVPAPLEPTSFTKPVALPAVRLDLVAEWQDQVVRVLFEGTAYQDQTLRIELPGEKGVASVPFADLT